VNVLVAIVIVAGLMLGCRSGQAPLVESLGDPPRVADGVEALAGTSAPLTALAFECDDGQKFVLTRVAGKPDAIDLRLGDRHQRLTHVRTGSGAQYTADGLSVWTKGREAMLEVAGRVTTRRRGLRRRRRGPPADRAHSRGSVRRHDERRPVRVDGRDRARRQEISWLRRGPALDSSPMPSEGPKSAYELAMERLRQKDREAGVEERPLTDQQKAAIAEARQVYQARMAEREILHRDALHKAQSREEVEKLESELARDRDRLASDRDRKIAEIKQQPT
jgi:membrane-bound inhibitor of C-type lysozyme